MDFTYLFCSFWLALQAINVNKNKNDSMHTEKNRFNTIKIISFPDYQKKLKKKIMWLQK